MEGGGYLLRFIPRVRVFVAAGFLVTVASFSLVLLISLCLARSSPMVALRRDSGMR